MPGLVPSVLYVLFHLLLRIALCRDGIRLTGFTHVLTDLFDE